MLNKDFDVLNNWMFGSLNELLNGININSELDLIKMSIGEPQLMPPEFVQEELKAFSSDWGKYPPTVAIPRLKNSIINYLERRFQELKILLIQIIFYLFLVQESLFT